MTTVDQRKPSAQVSAPMRVPVVDDTKRDADLVRWTLGKAVGRAYVVDWVDSFSAGMARIGERSHDAYLIDQRLGGAKGTDLIREVRSTGCQDPLILLTAMRDPTLDAEALQAGADDFIVKSESEYATIDRTLRYAINQARSGRDLLRSREQVWALERIGDLLSREGPTAGALTTTLGQVAEAFGYEHLALFFAEGGAFQFAARRGYGAAAVAAIDRSNTLLDRIVRSGTVRFVPNLTVVDREPPQPVVLAAGISQALADEADPELMLSGAMGALELARRSGGGIVVA